MDSCRRGGGRIALAIDVFESVLGQELVGPFGGVVGVRWACAEGDGEGDFGIMWCNRSGEGEDVFGIRVTALPDVDDGKGTLGRVWGEIALENDVKVDVGGIVFVGDGPWDRFGFGRREIGVVDLFDAWH